MAAVGTLGSGAASGNPRLSTSLSPLQRNDASVATLLQSQVVDATSPWRGSVPDQFGLHSAGSAGSVAEAMAASFVDPASRFHHDATLLDRIRLAAGFLERSQSRKATSICCRPISTRRPTPASSSTWSPPRRSSAGCTARPKSRGRCEPFLVKAGAGMAVGGVHTPNHRWVISAALAQINELFPDPRLVRRIDEWLAEGIDIDADGQFTERSTLTYNVVTDRALLVMAIKLQRPELLEPVRRNLHALAYLLHADGEVVTEISRRQDQYTRGGIAGYWFPLTWLAIADGDRRARDDGAAGGRGGAPLDPAGVSGTVAAAARRASRCRTISNGRFRSWASSRIRRGRIERDADPGWLQPPADAAPRRTPSSRACGSPRAFFGKGQFIPDAAGQRDGSVLVPAAARGALLPAARQDHHRRDVDARREPNVGRARSAGSSRRRRSPEVTGGFQVRLQAAGTPGVPLAVEIGAARRRRARRVHAGDRQSRLLPARARHGDAIAQALT